MVRVYVSSTSKDLEEFRAQVCETLRRMRHEDVAMEHYVAEDMRPVDKCLRDVENCDLYICIAAWRYGHIPEGYEHSITELEYRQAKATGKTCLTFVLDEDAPWKPSLIEFDAMDRVRAFRKELRKNRISKMFTSPEDLARQVAEAVSNWAQQQGIATAGERTNWEAYRAAVHAKYWRVQLDALVAPEHDDAAQIPLSDVFVAQQTTTGRPALAVREVADEQQEEAISPPPEDAGAVAELQEPSLQVIGRDAKQVFLGGPGSGKTTLMRYAMLSLCDPTPSGSVRIAGLTVQPPLPFLIELRQYAQDKTKGRVEDFVDYLVARGREFYDEVEIAPGDLRALLQDEGKALVLFDGLDEILQEGDRAQIADQVDAFANHHPGARIVVTTRIAGYNPERLQGYGFSHYTLGRFGLTEIRQFLQRWYRQHTEQEDTPYAAELSARIAASPRLRELAGNPLLLTMMAIIYKHEELPEKRWKLYERCTKVLLEHWDVKRKHIERDKPLPLGFEMTGEHKAEILQRVSMHMLQNRRGGRLNAIRRHTLIGILADYLTEEKFGKKRGEAEVIAAEILNHLCERTYILAEIGGDTFGFVHRTFMEYFAACHVLAGFNRREANYEWLTQEVYEANWRRDEWEEVLLLLTAMLAGQGSPITKIVDHLHGLVVGEPPSNIVFAARCLAEAGPDDNAWARATLDRLAQKILVRTGQADTSGGGGPAEFVNQALGAFSMLVLAVRPSEQLVAEIEASDPIPRRRRIVAWQMKLALRSRDERLPFAIRALTDRIEAIRVGAITALEREWPGRVEVGPQLLRVLRTDRSEGVRQAAVQALRRAWPDQPGILEAIAERVGTDTSDTYRVWLIRYLSSEWRHNLAALDVVFQLAATRHQPTSVVVLDDGDILRGWGDRPGIGAWLQDRFAVVHDPHVRDAILIAVARGGLDGMLGWLRQRVDEVPSASMARPPTIQEIARNWAGRSDLLAWLQQHAIHGEPETRQAALGGLAEGWGADPQLRVWLGKRAVDDPDLDVRLHALTLVGGYKSFRPLLASLSHSAQIDPYTSGLAWEHAIYWGGHPESIPLLEAQAVNDPSPVIRQAALSGVYAYRASSKTALDLLYSRLVQEPDRDTRAMILLWLTEGASGGTALPRGLAVTLGFNSPRTQQVDRPFSGFPRPSSPADDGLRATLTSVAENDEDENLRAAAAQAITALWGDRPEVSEWLAERIRKDPSQSARALLKSFRIR